MDERVKEVVNEKTKESAKIRDPENTSDTPVPEDDKMEEHAAKEGIDVFKLISKIVSDMSDKAIVKSRRVPEEDEEVEKNTIEFEIFKEFEDTSQKEGQQFIPDEYFVCGECGLFGNVKSKIETHMERTHNDTQYADLKAENRKIFKELGETKSTLYEVQFQLQESEETLAETMKEVMCLEEDNNDKAKIVDSLLADRSTVDEYEEDGEELGFWNANEETSSTNEEPEVVEVQKTSNHTRSDSLDSGQQQCPKCDFVPSRPIYMKSHMLIKHKEDQAECLKCKKKFPTKKDLNNHMNTKHNNNLHSCTYCEAKFLVAHALKQHTQAVHKERQTLPVGHPERSVAQSNANQTNPKGFKCRICGKAHTSGIMLDEHLSQCSQDQTRQLCKFFAEGRCTKGRWCKFSHHVEGNHVGSNEGGFINQECRRGPQCHFLAQNRCQFFHQVQHNQPMQQQSSRRQVRQHPRQQRQQHQNMMPTRQYQQQPMQKWVEPCRRGPGCVFWAEGTCFYFHEEVSLQDVWQQKHLDQSDQQPPLKKACRYMEDCNRVPNCPFQHYNVDFPQATRKQTRK